MIVDPATIPAVGAILDCGDPRPAMPTPGPTGYARTADGRTMCYAHADESERAAFLVAGMTGEPFTAYVSSAGDLTTWTGGILATGIARRHGVSRSGWQGSEVHAWRFRSVVVGSDSSAEWYGRNAGPGMVITVRRAKTRTPRY